MALFIEVALIGWFPLTMGLFLLLRPHIAAAISLSYGVAFLPSLREIDLPVIPDLNQYTVPVIGCIVMVALRSPRRLMAARPGTGADLLVIGLMIGSFLTNVTNMDPQIFGPTILPGMSLTDTVNDSLETLFRFGLPFLLGRALVRNEQEATDVLLVLATLTLLYLPFIFVEFWIGPFWHPFVYGSHPAIETFWHSVRMGGYRPNVFMNHGLTLSGFMCYMSIVSAGLYRLKVKPHRIPNGPYAVLVTAFTMWCKSRAVWLYILVAVPATIYLKPRLNMLAITILAAAVIGYPFLRSVDVLPIREINEIAAEYGGQMATVSFMQRIETEDDIMRRTAERYWFGWGGYSRFFIYDPVTGRTRSVMDGYWVVAFGEGGIFRFLQLYGFLLFPIFYAYSRFGRMRSKHAQIIAVTLGWIVVIRTFDLIPNSTLDPYLTFLGGALVRLVQETTKTRLTDESETLARPDADLPPLSRPSAGLSAAEASRVRLTPAPPPAPPHERSEAKRDEPNGSASLGVGLTDRTD